MDNNAFCLHFLNVERRLTSEMLARETVQINRIQLIRTVTKGALNKCTMQSFALLTTAIRSRDFASLLIA